MSKAGSSSKTSMGDGDSIQVYVRVRPPIKEEGDMDFGACLTVDTNSNAVVMKAKPEAKVFTFDQVADITTTQESVFSNVAKALIDSCLTGYNGTIFAYGQTGSGKTFTMIGPSEDSFHQELRGLIPRSFEYLFGLVNRQKELLGDRVQFCCRATFLEIYNEQIYDLLDAGSTGLQLRENIKRGVFVDGLSEQVVNTASDAYDVLQAGWTNRSVASTSMNRESSRSHAVFTLHIESKENKQGTWQLRSSQLNLVDLAGSERQKDTKTDGIRLKEGCSINKSLSSLGNVIMALVHISQDKNRHVPYRDSKLTFLLRDSLGGNAKTHIIACVHPGNKCFGETLSTLQFARRAKQIKNKAVVNEDLTGDMAALQAELKRLKEEIVTKDNLISEIQASGVGSVAVCTSSGGSDVWQGRFIEAMRMYVVALSKLDLRDRKHELLEEQLKQKDRKILQTKMILQFRNDTLKKWEAERKKQAEPGSQDLVLSLREEIKALEEYNSSKHDIQVMRQENKKLEREKEALTQQISVQNKRQEELDAIFENAQKEKEAKPQPMYTPQQQTTEEPVSTVERQKSQLSKLQAEIDTLKRTFAVESENLQKKLMETESDLASVKAVKDELEKNLKLTQQRATIERENQEKLHMDTIKTITTPKKAKYQLRNRVVHVPNSGSTPVLMSPLVDGSESPPPLSSPGPVLTDNTEEEDGMRETQMPNEMFVEQIEGLTTEIQTIRKENADLVQKLGSSDRKAIDMVEEKSKILSINSSLEKKIAEYQKILDQHQEIVTTLQKARDDVLESKELADSELSDLRVVMKQTDKHMAEIRAEREVFKQAATSAESKVSSLSYQLEESERRNGDLIVALSSTKEDTERIQSELEYTLHQSQELETRLQSEVTKHSETRRSLENLQLRLNQEQATIQQLTSQLQEQGTEKEKELLSVIERQKATEDELVVSRQQLEAAQEHIAQKSLELSNSHNMNLQLEKAKKEMEDAMLRVSNERNKLREDQRVQLSDLEDARSQINQLEQQHQQESLVMENEMEQMKEELNHQVAILEHQLEEKDNELNRLAVQISMAQDDIEQFQDLEEALKSRVIELEAESEKQKIDMSQLQEVKEKLSQRIVELDSKVAQTEEKLITQQGLYENLLKEREAETETQAMLKQLQEERDAMYIDVVEKNQDLRKTREDISYLTKQLEEQEKTLEEMKGDADDVQEKSRAEIKEKEQTIEYWRQIAANSQTQYNDMTKKKMELELIISQKDMHLKEKEHVIERNRLQVEQSADIKEKLKNVSEEMDNLLKDNADKDDQIERIRAVTTSDQELLTKLKSDLEVQQEILRHVKLENEDMRGKLEKAETEAARLAGHSNINQKIQYVQSLKDTNWSLTEANAECEKKILQLEMELKQLRKEPQVGKPSTPLRPAVARVTPSKQQGGKTNVKGATSGKAPHWKPSGNQKLPEHNDEKAAAKENKQPGGL